MHVYLIEIQQKYDQKYCWIYIQKYGQIYCWKYIQNTVRYTAGYTYIYGLMYMHVFLTNIQAYTDIY